MCGISTGFDSGEPFSRSQIGRITNDATARNSLCQFCNDSNQNLELRYLFRSCYHLLLFRNLLIIISSSCFRKNTAKCLVQTRYQTLRKVNVYATLIRSLLYKLAPVHLEFSIIRIYLLQSCNAGYGNDCA